MLVDRRIGFIGEGRSDNFINAGLARSGGENSWINAVARDDSENLWRCLGQAFNLAYAGRRRGDRLCNLLAVTAAFDVQLRERLLQRSLNRGDFFGGVIFFHRCLGAFHGLFRRGDVDLFRLQRHVGQD